MVETSNQMAELNNQIQALAKGSGQNPNVADFCAKSIAVMKQWLEANRCNKGELPTHADACALKQRYNKTITTKIDQLNEKRKDYYAEFDALVKKSDTGSLPEIEQTRFSLIKNMKENEEKVDKSIASKIEILFDDLDKPKLTQTPWLGRQEGSNEDEEFGDSWKTVQWPAEEQLA